MLSLNRSCPEGGRGRQTHTQKIDGHKLSSNSTVRNASCLSCTQMGGCIFSLRVVNQSSLLRATQKHQDKDNGGGEAGGFTG